MSATWRNAWLPRSILLLILIGNFAFDAIGLDWGLPYLWHSDEKVKPANDMIAGRTLNPHYFINPTLHIYAVAVALSAACAIRPYGSVVGPPPDHDSPRNRMIAEAYRKYPGSRYQEQRVRQLVRERQLRCGDRGKPGGSSL